MDKEPVAIIVDVIRTRLGLTNDQIWQYNQPKVIPNTFSGVFVIVHYMGSGPLAVTSQFAAVDDTFVETVSTQEQELFSIEIISRDGSAKTMYPQIMAALKSTYSVQQQEKYNFRIAQNPINVKNISAQDGGSMLTKIIVDTFLLAWSQYSSSVDYFDQFSNTISSNP